ncbi:MAG: PAS domain S-box protein [Magnetococcales bacterium]|nr:PAS domain S-box protein [Magnetococcales bacterium]
MFPKILIVDDKQANLTALRKLLSDIHAEVIEATSGNDALSLLVDHEFALLLLDVDMPVMDGFEVARMVRAVEETREIPIIFLTAAFKDDLHRIKGYEVGAADYIEKPINDQILFSKISVFLQLYEAKRLLKNTIAELKDSNAKLTKSQHNLLITQFAVDNAGDAVFRLDHKACVLYANEMACKSLGYTLDELLNMSVPEFDPDFPVERWPSFWEEQKCSGTQQFRSTHKCKSGKIFPVEIATNFMVVDGQESIWASVRDISDRVKAEGHRRTLEQAIEHSPSSIVITNKDGAIEYVNPKFTKVTGYLPVEAIGQNPRILKTGHTSQEEYKLLWETLLAGKEWHGEFMNKKKDGTNYWENVSISPVLSDTGEIIHFIGIKEDITLRRMNDQRLKMALEASNDGIWDWNIETGSCFFSHRWFQMMELSSNEVKPHKTSWTERIHKKEQADVLQTLESCLDGKIDSFESEHRLKSGSGAWLWMRVKGKVTERDSEGKPLRMVGTQSDITLTREWLEMLRKTNDKLQKSEKNYRSLVDNVPGVVYRCAIDSKWTMFFISNAISDLSGYPAEDFIDNNTRCYSSIIHPEDLKHVGFVIDKAIQNHKAFELEYRIIHANGETRWVYERGCIGQYQDGEPEFLDGVIVDNTERKKMEVQIHNAKQEAEKANNAKSQFLAAMSHDIRTPMNAILGMGEVLSQSNLDNSQRHDLGVLTHAGEGLLALINDILDLSKIEAGQLQMEIVSFDLREMIKGTFHILHQKAKEKNLIFTYQVDPNCFQLVIGDQQRLRQILLNLLGNAIKFTKSGNITLTVESLKKDEIQFVVTDTGIGIPAEKLDTIFQPFTQAEDSINRRFGGSGLGLSICQLLVEKMGGIIKVESKLGKGSKFSFYVQLPQSAVGISDTVSTQKSWNKQHHSSVVKDVTKQKPLQILLVDDAEDNQIVVEAFLKKTSHSLTNAKNGKKAVEAFQSSNFDLILMDMMMPVMDGFEATRQIRSFEKHHGRQPTPIVALTANAMKEDMDKTISAGCDLCLSKPIRMANLLNVVDHFAKTTIEKEKNINDSVVASPKTVESASDPLKPACTINMETLDILNKEIGGDINRTLKKFHEKLPTRLNAIIEAIEQGDTEGVKNASHKLKGSSATLGMDRLTSICREIELASKSGLLPKNGKLESDLKEECRLVRSEVEKILQGTNG